MKLNYKILWIDDNIEDIIDLGIKDELISFVESKEFIATIDCFEDTKTAIAKLESEKYDLILSDYNIDEREQNEEKQGDYLINQIRQNDIFTEVLFYSSDSNFKEIAMKLYQDRVSFFSLLNDVSYKEFKNKTFKLIDLTITKLEELNNIRGLVMSETSELDNTLEDILHNFLSKGDNNSIKLREYIIQKIIKSCTDNLNEANKLSELNNISLLKIRIFDSTKKSMSLNKICKLLKLEGESYSKFHENYYKDVIETRNDLAHAKSDIIDGIEYLIISRKDGEHPIKFNQEHCVQIRRNLKKHSELLKTIREIIIR
jgi:CheY-like chemotaxis protein